MRSLNRSAVARVLLFFMCAWILGGCTAWQPSDRAMSDILADGAPARVRIVGPGVLRTEITVAHAEGDSLYGTNIVRKSLDDGISPPFRALAVAVDRTTSF